MVRDHAQGDVALGPAPECYAREILRAREDRHEQVRLVVAAKAREHLRHALEAGARVDGRLRQRREHATRVAIELHEHEVPELEEAARAAGRVVVVETRHGPAIEVDLRARAARPGVAHLPEVLARPEPVDLVRRDPDLALPDLRCLLVLVKHRDNELGRIDLPALRDQLPGELDRLALEVIAEREVPEHLEEGVVARAAADLFEIVVLARDAHALLRGGRALVRARLLAGEDALERHHASVREQQRRVVDHERGAGDARVPFRLEEIEEALANLMGRALRRHEFPFGAKKGRRLTAASARVGTRQQAKRAASRRRAESMRKISDCAALRAIRSERGSQRARSAR